MKTKILAAIALAVGLCDSAFATDYNVGQLPVPFTYEYVNGSWVNVPTGNVTFSSGLGKTSTWSDTLTLFLGNWSESALYYPPAGATYVYTSANAVVVWGVDGSQACGKGCSSSHYYTTVTAATLDGVPMTQSGTQWFTYGTLAPGSHTISAQGTASGLMSDSHWNGQVQGLTYTLVYNPAPPSCNDCGGD